MENHANQRFALTQPVGREEKQLPKILSSGREKPLNIRGREFSWGETTQEYVREEAMGCERPLRETSTSKEARSGAGGSRGHNLGLKPGKVTRGMKKKNTFQYTIMEKMVRKKK